MVDAPNPDLTADPFAALADSYEAWYATPLGAHVVEQEERALLGALGDADGAVLEVGAGTGWWSRILAGRGWSVTAVEPSAAMRRVGESRTAGLDVRWVDGAGEHLPFAESSFDVALIMTALEFAADPHAVLAEAWRTVRPGGLLIVGILDALSPWAALYRHLADQGVAPWTAARFLAADAAERMLGRPADTRRGAVWLAPAAEPPYADADVAGRTAGNAPALTVLSWRKPA